MKYLKIILEILKIIIPFTKVSLKNINGKIRNVILKHDMNKLNKKR